MIRLFGILNLFRKFVSKSVLLCPHNDTRLRFSLFSLYPRVVRSMSTAKNDSKLVATPSTIVSGLNLPSTKVIYGNMLADRRRVYKDAVKISNRAVYCFFSQSKDTLLYVGLSNDFQSRARNYYKMEPTRVSKLLLEHLEAHTHADITLVVFYLPINKTTKQDVADFEVDMVRRYKTLFNISPGGGLGGSRSEQERKEARLSAAADIYYVFSPNVDKRAGAGNQPQLELLFVAYGRTHFKSVFYTTNDILDSHLNTDKLYRNVFLVYTRPFFESKYPNVVLDASAAKFQENREADFKVFAKERLEVFRQTGGSLQVSQAQQDMYARNRRIYGKNVLVKVVSTGQEVTFESKKTAADDLGISRRQLGRWFLDTLNGTSRRTTKYGDVFVYDLSVNSEAGPTALTQLSQDSVSVPTSDTSMISATGTTSYTSSTGDNTVPLIPKSTICDARVTSVASYPSFHLTVDGSVQTLQCNSHKDERVLRFGKALVLYVVHLRDGSLLYIGLTDDYARFPLKNIDVNLASIIDRCGESSFVFTFFVFPSSFDSQRAKALLLNLHIQHRPLFNYCDAERKDLVTQLSNCGSLIFIYGKDGRLLFICRGIRHAIALFGSHVDTVNAYLDATECYLDFFLLRSRVSVVDIVPEHLPAFTSEDAFRPIIAYYAALHHARPDLHAVIASKKSATALKTAAAGGSKFRRQWLKITFLSGQPAAVNNVAKVLFAHGFEEAASILNVTRTRITKILAETDGVRPVFNRHHQTNVIVTRVDGPDAGHKK